MDFYKHFIGMKVSVKTFFRWLLFSCIVGVVVGLVGIAFHFAVELSTELRTEQPWLLYLLPVGGVAIALLYKICGMENDRGTNNVISAVRSNDDIPIRMAPLIFIGSVITHLFGGSSGREGAALQLGGSISHKIGTLLKLDEKDERIITMCGMSAAFSALFGTPVTAAIFSMEVISVGVMYYSAIVPCVVSAMISIGLASLLHVPPTQFYMTGIPALTLGSSVRVLMLGALCAAVSVVFCVIMDFTKELYHKKFKNTLVRAFAGGLIVIAVTTVIGCRDYNGVGIDIIEQAFAGYAKNEAFFFKMILTALTLGAGFKGGEIVPAFFIGATFGNIAGGFLGLDPSFGAGLGLAAVFCGVTNCPLTSVILGVELFNGDNDLLFFGAACAVSYMLSGYFGLYAEQKIIYSKVKAEFVDRKTV